MENLRGNNIFKNAERKNNSEVEKVGRKNLVNWNCTNSIINWNQKYSDSIHVYPNHTGIGSIHDSANIRAI